MPNRSATVASPQNPSCSVTSVAPLEVGGAFDSLVNLEELLPDVDWPEVLTATWGLPHEELPQPLHSSPLHSSPTPSSIAQPWFHRVRSVLRSFRIGTP
ncbi:hypothetical protein [Alkalinema sp. FACHB-956]|uniref:hypothetical protein n=1 Tax=Alkalinema sp. FACHB-956 TaxID=2692768 RepID=UPI00168A3DE9|nr:hypothetical protein [Alkalinema sp. FACHB-956]MBD2326112.1 hypothetical protein [Alkalinema sp. FACHB-956]